MENIQEYFDLLKTWTDRLISLQAKSSEPYFRGGIMCPACTKVHGRCGDTILPFMYMYKMTHDEKYIIAAREVFDWSEYNIVRKDNSFINDSNNDWRGITIFSVIAIAETLDLFSDLLDDATRIKWMTRLRKSSARVFHLIDEINPNVNYPISCAAALSLAGKVLGNDEYLHKAKRIAHSMLKYFTSENLIYGEGNPTILQTEKGCQAIDIGYNVEESLPSFIIYCQVTEDKEVFAKILESLYAHLPFFIPDGGWDNSWGTRNAKWSYWGSRTSDGCLMAYGLLDHIDSKFGEVAYRNFKIMKECTHDGLLMGGPMYFMEGEPACVHHTFCHAKGLALMLAKGHAPKPNPELLAGDFFNVYQNGNLVAFSIEKWRGTISTIDYQYYRGSNSTGGCITFLWNAEVGPIFAATMPQYSLSEPANMQIPKRYPVECNSFRIEHISPEKKVYSNLYDLSARMKIDYYKYKYVVSIEGELVSAEGERINIAYNIKYTLEVNKITIDIETTLPVTLRCPIVSDTSNIENTNGMLRLKKKNGSVVNLDFGEEMPLFEINDTGEPSLKFNPVGGMCYISAYTQCSQSHKLIISISR